MQIEFLRQFGQGLIVLQSGDDYFRLERRCMIFLGLLIYVLLLRALHAPIRADSPLIGQSYFAGPPLMLPIHQLECFDVIISVL